MNLVIKNLHDQISPADSSLSMALWKGIVATELKTLLHCEEFLDVGGHSLASCNTTSNKPSTDCDVIPEAHEPHRLVRVQVVTHTFPALTYSRRKFNYVPV